jgi:phage shock protein PspC (stress-responsive transcriptional regulator)
MVAGVCSGIARALALEIWVVRLIFLILVIGFGTGVLAYIVLWFIMPEERSGTVIQPYTFEQSSINERRVTVASVLMLVGAYMLVNLLFGAQVWRYALPAALIIGGIILFSSKK